MSTPVPDRYRLDYNGRLLEVEAEPARLTRSTRLFIDDEQVDEHREFLETSAELVGGGVTVKVSWGLFGQVTKCVVVPAATRDNDSADDEIPFEPPEGAYAARIARLEHEHPSLYASRHVTKALVQALVGLLSIGVILRGLLPNLDLPSIPWPDFGFSAREWIRKIPDPLELIFNLFPDVSFSIPWTYLAFVDR